MNLTPKQLRIFEFIRKHRATKGYSPTMQEIADSLGVTKVTVFEHVEALIKKGALEDAELPNESADRQLHDAEGPAPMPLQFPLVGRIAAGRPIEKCAQDETLRLEELFSPRRGQSAATMFALQVDGESMRDEGILDGDYVIVERRDTARNGERVVALLPDGETTLKTFFKERDGRIRLQPANPDFEPIIVDTCAIQGVVVGVMRRYCRILRAATGGDRLAHLPDDRAADDRAVGVPQHGPHVVARRDAEARRHRQRRVPPDAIDDRRHVRGIRTLAGDPDARQRVDEPRAESRDPRDPLLARGGRDQEGARDPRAVAGGTQGGRVLDVDVRHDQAVEPGRRGIHAEAAHADPVDDRHADHRHELGRDPVAHLADRGEDAGRRATPDQRLVHRLRDHRPVRDRVAERDPHLDHGHARRRHPRQQRARRGERRIARRHERQHGAARAGAWEKRLEGRGQMERHRDLNRKERDMRPPCPRAAMRYAESIPAP